MSKRISTTLLFTVVIAVVALFATTQTQATGTTSTCVDDWAVPCSEQEMDDFECFESAGYRVRVVKGMNGEFPVIPEGSTDSEFEYNICKIHTRPIKHVAILFPNNCEPLLEITDSDPSCGEDPQDCVRPYDLLTGLGKWQSLLDVYRWAAPWSSHRYGGFFSLTVEGRRVAEQTAMVIRTRSLLPHHWGSGNILGPACFASGDPVSYFIPFSKTVDGIHCEGKVHLEPSFYVQLDTDLSSPVCAVTSSAPYPVGNLTLGGPTETANDLPEGWFGYSGSPTEYCYYNKKKKKYQCVRY